MKFDLSQEDFEALLLALGIAAGTCLREGRKGMALRIIELTNTVNKNNPRWIPYDTANERTSDPNPQTASIQTPKGPQL